MSKKITLSILVGAVGLLLLITGLTFHFKAKQNTETDDTNQSESSNTDSTVPYVEASEDLTKEYYGEHYNGEPNLVFYTADWCTGHARADDYILVYEGTFEWIPTWTDTYVQGSLWNPQSELVMEGFGPFITEYFESIDAADAYVTNYDESNDFYRISYDRKTEYGYSHFVVITAALEEEGPGVNHVWIYQK